MNERLRSPRPEDLATIARISAHCYPERPEQPDHWTGVTDVQPYWVLTSPESGRVIGYGAARREPGSPPEAGIWRIHLGVAPEHRRQGAGGVLLKRLLAALRERGGKEARIRLRHTSEEALHFLRMRGFQPVQEVLHLVQELAELPALRPHELPGIRFTTLQQEQTLDPEGAVARLHALYATAIQDIPTGQANTPPPLEAFRHSLQASGVLPACCWIARDGEAYVGASWAAPHPTEPAVLGHHFTGVLPAYRGRGIARALKIRVTQYACAHGYQRVRTATLAANRPMRAVNERLGFRTAYSEIRLQRPL